SGPPPGLSNGVCTEGRGRTFDRGDRICARFERTCGKIAAVTGAVAAPGTVGTLLPETREWRWQYAMKCSDFLHELTNYLDGVLDDKTKIELENHLSWCHNCYVVCDTTKKTIEIYRDSELYTLPEDLRSRLRSAIMTKCQQQKKRGPQSV